MDWEKTATQLGVAFLIALALRPLLRFVQRSRDLAGLPDVPTRRLALTTKLSLGWGPNEALKEREKALAEQMALLAKSTSASAAKPDKPAEGGPRKV